MRYLLIIHGDEKAQATATKAEKEQVFAAYMTYTNELKQAGVMLGGDALLPSMQGAKVTVRGGKRSVVDGPFQETKEVIGGYYLIQCDTLDEAKSWAAKCPGASHGTMEVRAVMDYPG